MPGPGVASLFVLLNVVTALCVVGTMVLWSRTRGLDRCGGCSGSP
jgi:hypothetical protein